MPFRDDFRSVKIRGVIHVRAHGGGTNGGARLRGKILDFRGLGSPGRPGNPSKRWGAKLPHLFEGFPGRPGPAQTPTIQDFPSQSGHPVSATPM